MSKLRLEDLHVESFSTTGERPGFGTVHGHQISIDAACMQAVAPADDNTVGAVWSCQNTCNHVAYPECRFQKQTDVQTCCRSCDLCATAEGTPDTCQYSCTKDAAAGYEL